MACEALIAAVCVLGLRGLGSHFSEPRFSELRLPELRFPEPRPKYEPASNPA
jgi:hypothetical protein